MASAGRVLLMPKGTWTANTAYTALDFVYYGGNSYVCKAAVSGTTNPANDTAHWQQMASGFDSDLITQTITNEPNHIASDAAVYAECQKLEAADDHFLEDLASVEEAATSALVYSAGDYLMYQDQLYKATTDIAVGDPLVSGTNIRAVTVGEEMADLAASGASNTTAISQYAADMASVETSTSASKAYSVGEYLMLAGQLYKVTAAIASGGTLEVGTNISAVNLGDQLKSLNDSLTKNNIGAFVDITSQSTSPNKYTFPSDGYVFSSLSGSGNMYLTLYSASNDNQLYYGIASAGNNPFIVYVKKGMRIAINNTISGLTPTIRFYQLI